MPVGAHQASDYGFGAFGEHATFKLELFDDDDESLGRFIVTSDDSTVFLIDGEPVTLEQTLDAFGQYRGYIHVVVREPGKLARMELSTQA